MLKENNVNMCATLKKFSIDSSCESEFQVSIKYRQHYLKYYILFLVWNVTQNIITYSYIQKCSHK